MLENALALAREYEMFPPGAAVLCAVSGGADSMCLLHWLSRQPGLVLHAAHFDHRLRGEASERDAAFVRDWCAGRGIPFHLGSADVAAAAAAEKRGVEETARRLRYEFLSRTARQVGAQVIATAHTADDNIETFLLHLLRGSGLQGLTGIAPRRGSLVRPLLTTSRSQVEDYLRAHAVPFVEDATNADTSYTRNSLRHTVVPLLRTYNSDLPASMADTIRRLRADNDCLNAQAALLSAAARPTEGGLALPADRVADQCGPIAVRVVRQLLERLGEYDFSAAHLQSVVELCRGGGPSARVDLPHGLTARRVYGDLLLTRRAQPPPPFAPVPLELDGVTAAGDWRVECRSALCPAERTDNVWYLRRDALDAAALLRPRREGDAISLPGRGTKTVKKLLIDAKLPRWERAAVPLLVRGEQVVAVAGFGCAGSCLAKPGEDAWVVIFHSNKREEDGETT